ncbi:hypothetical protein HZS55_00740 [Halosimplex rubrum]|uniref:Metal-dependent hydrolase n=1 Tax=Halosimplex rubrum TaxID=869889 RepID=A0A7D5NY41_9EURY|nr:hypothetical protein [Halosimplex rubrum]QLH75917.1 hypothetical protein HZS55_00740 [Halosimplex rubrum]
MKSASHAAVSLAVAVAALLVTTPPIPAWAVVAVALVVGVGIDVDHFLLAWYNTGSLDPVRRCLRDPRIVFVAQDEIFDEGSVGALNRLLSHVLAGGVAVPLLWLRSPYVAGLVAAALYAHVLADLVSTTRAGVVVERSAVDRER